MKYKNNYIILLVLFLILVLILVLSLNKYTESYIENNKRFEKIYIFQGNTIGIVEFMYKPAVITITTLLKKQYENVPIIFKTNDYNYDEITSNDIFIWVGADNMNNVNFDELKNRNIYTIFYNLDPVLDSVNTNELWVYSKQLFYDYDKKINDGQILKFVPIVAEETDVVVDYKHTNVQDIKLC
jgi:hypothetical protein